MKLINETEYESRWYGMWVGTKFTLQAKCAKKSNEGGEI